MAGFAQHPRRAEIGRASHPVAHPRLAFGRASFIFGERAMRPWLWVIAFASSIVAAVAEDLPAVVQKAIAEAGRDCKTAATQKSFITGKDINEDRQPDFVLDYASFFCDGDQRPFCDSLGCTTRSRPSMWCKLRV